MPVRPLRCVWLAVWLAVGCGREDTITTYEIPKPAEYRSQVTSESPVYRTLGAMFPADDPVWFFKFSGRAESLARYEADFDRLLSSVRLNPDKDGEPQLPSFQTPPDWTRTGRRIVRRGGVSLPIEETLRFGPPEDPLEITITRSGGGVAANISRWADQVGYKYSKAEELMKVTRAVAGDGVQGLRVDVSGNKNPAAARGPLMGLGS